MALLVADVEHHRLGVADSDGDQLWRPAAFLKANHLGGDLVLDLPGVGAAIQRFMIGGVGSVRHQPVPLATSLMRAL